MAAISLPAMTDSVLILSKGKTKGKFGILFYNLTLLDSEVWGQAWGLSAFFQLQSFYNSRQTMPRAQSNLSLQNKKGARRLELKLSRILNSEKKTQNCTDSNLQILEKSQMFLSTILYFDKIIPVDIITKRYNGFHNRSWQR